MDPDADDLLRRFRDRTLPKPAWTHEAHVTVCWATLRDHDARAALDALRVAIRSYNDAVGTLNTDESGYHETLTQYYVEAVAALSDRMLTDVLDDPSCSRTAPLRHWSKERLFSVAARRAWLDPDLAPLPWATPPPLTGAGAGAA